MCIGIPMQVVERGEFHALCDDGARQVQVDTTLVGQPAVGSWLLVFLGAAREALDEPTALAMRDAVNAVGRIMQGDNRIDDLFGDLVDREPQAPAHLQHLIKEA